MRVFVAVLAACLALGFVVVSPFWGIRSGVRALAGGAVLGFGRLASGALRAATRA